MRRLRTKRVFEPLERVAVHRLALRLKLRVEVGHAPRATRGATQRGVEGRELGASARVALGELVVPRVVVAFGGVETRVVARGVFGDDVAEFRALVRELAFLAPEFGLHEHHLRLERADGLVGAGELRLRACARARVLAVSRQLLDATAPRSNLPGGGGKGDAKISGAEVGGRAEMRRRRNTIAGGSREGANARGIEGRRGRHQGERERAPRHGGTCAYIPSGRRPARRAARKPVG